MCRQPPPPLITKNPSNQETAPNNNSERFGLCLQVLSVCLFSVMGVFVKLTASLYHLPSSQLVFLRSTIQGILVLVCLILWRVETKQQGQINSRLLWYPFGGNRHLQKIVLLRGLVGGTGFCCAYYTMSVLPLGDAAASLSLFPIPTIFLASLLLHEPIQKLQIVTMLLSVSGALLIAKPTLLFGESDSHHHNDTPSSTTLGYVAGLLGSCLAAGVVTLIRHAGLLGAHTLQLLCSWVCFGIVLSSLGALLQDWKWPPEGRCWMYVMGMALFGSAAHFLLNYAGRLVPASKSSIVRSSNLVWAYFLEIVIFHVHPDLYTWGGVALILGSLGMVALRKMQTERRTETEPNTGIDLDTTEGETSFDEELQDEDVELQELQPAMSGRSIYEALPSKDSLDDPV